MKKFVLSLCITACSYAFAAPQGQYITHTVEKGQTLYSISKKYGMKPDELARYNNAVGADFKISVGQVLRIPTNDVASTADAQKETPVAAKPASRTVSLDAVTSDEGPSAPADPYNDRVQSQGNAYHTVAKGETFYSISRMYNMDREELQQINHIDNLTLRVGQRLKVKAIENVTPAAIHEAPTAKSNPASDDGVIKVKSYTWTMADEGQGVTSTNGDLIATTRVVEPSASNPAGKEIKEWHVESVNDKMNLNADKNDPANDYERIFYQYMYSGMKKLVESGMAKTVPATMNLAYYNKAEVGTILKLTNPQNSKVAYAIVVGKVSDATGPVTIKVSNAVARQLSTPDLATVEISSYQEN
ncbi:MAG: LysM peptidoglycan-binding domain-containing protein [Chitinophagales bacterium]